MLLAVVMAIGRPAVFPDTDDYFANGRKLALQAAYALHVRAPPAAPTDPDEIADAKQRAVDARLDRAQMKARSPIYGLFLWFTQRLGALWATTAAQAFVAAWMVWRLWRTSAPEAPGWSAFAVQGVTAVLSTAAMFAGFAMPDIFAGAAALAAVALISGWSGIRPPERAALALLMTFAAIIHGSHALILVAVLVPGIGLGLWLRADRRQLAAAGLTIVGAIAAAILINWALFQSVQRQTGDAPGRPPFLAMRVIADGPGRAYLRQACGRAGVEWVLCRFKALPLDNSDRMMWSDRKSDGVFNVSDYPTRVAMERQEFPFVVAVIRSDPLGVIGSAVANWGRQLTGVYLDDPLLDPHYYYTNPYWRTTNLPWLIDRGRGCGPDHHGCRPRLSSTASWWLHSTVCLLSVLALLGRMAMPDVRGWLRQRRFVWADRTTRVIVVTALVSLAFVGNALICGALSGPFPRYGARMAWIITAGAASTWAGALPLAAPGWVRRAFDHPRIRLFTDGLEPAMARFAMVGGAGFVIDRLLLQGAMTFLHLNQFTGRLVSFSLAVVCTWALNRAFTFRQARHAHPPLRQALIYAGVQFAGGLLNYGAYALALIAIPALKAHLLIPLALGSAAGLCVTYVGSRRLAFRPAPESAV